MTKWKELSIASFTDYAAFLSDKCDGERWLFRGQSEDQDLLPKVARPDLQLHDGVLASERRMFEQFGLEAVPYLAMTVRSQWDLLIIAQHHGLPTRLLDWSQNPLAALWFAVEHPARTGKPGVVWAFNFADDLLVDRAGEEEPFNVSSTRLLRPSHITRRLVAQAGWFTVHAPSADGKGLEIMQMSPLADRLTKITIPASIFADLRYHLDRCGINRATLYPDLDGLCRHIQWKHTCSLDEAGD